MLHQFSIILWCFFLKRVFTSNANRGGQEPLPWHFFDGFPCSWQVVTVRSVAENRPKLIQKWQTNSAWPGITITPWEPKVALRHTQHCWFGKACGLCCFHYNKLTSMAPSKLSFLVREASLKQAAVHKTLWSQEMCKWLICCGRTLFGQCTQCPHGGAILQLSLLWGCCSLNLQIQIDETSFYGIRPLVHVAQTKFFHTACYSRTFKGSCKGLDCM